MKVLDVIFCDDIRQENTNKHIVIGVYSEELIFRNFVEGPRPLQLSLFVRLLIDKVLPHKFRVIFLDGNKKLQEVDGSFSNIDPKRMITISAIAQLTVEPETEISVLLQLLTDSDEVDEQLLARTIRIRQAIPN